MILGGSYIHAEVKVITLCLSVHELPQIFQILKQKMCLWKTKDSNAKWLVSFSLIWLLYLTKNSSNFWNKFFWDLRPLNALLQCFIWNIFLPSNSNCMVKGSKSVIKKDFCEGKVAFLLIYFFLFFFLFYWDFFVFERKF